MKKILLALALISASSTMPWGGWFSGYNYCDPMDPYCYDSDYVGLGNNVGGWGRNRRNYIANSSGSNQTRSSFRGSSSRGSSSRGSSSRGSSHSGGHR